MKLLKIKRSKNKIELLGTGYLVLGGGNAKTQNLEPKTQHPELKCKKDKF